MFEFVYKGKFDSLITKETFELYIRTLYGDLKKLFQVTWSPKKFVTTMEINPRKDTGWGGVNWFDAETNTFHLQIQLFGFSKKEQSFKILNELFGNTLLHELLHFFIPPVQDNSCWTEGVTDFMTFWYTHAIEQNLAKAIKEYAEIDDEAYKQHKYGYFTGLKKMARLYFADSSVIDDMRRIITDFNKNLEAKKEVYTAADIVAYNPKFKTFFLGRCNKHVAHELD